MNNSETLIVIPARGGSKGVPRKNLRPLYGRPLLWYSIQTARGVPDATVVVSTEDEEIALFAKRFGAHVLRRPTMLSADDSTVDDVVAHAVSALEQSEALTPHTVVTIQPTSPLLQSSDIVEAIRVLREHADVDTVMSGTEDRHLRWRRVGREFVPEYERRVNRQFLPETLKENGAIIACRRSVIDTGSRIGRRVRIITIAPDRSIDIDTSFDFQICEALLARRRIVISVTGYPEIGSGHVHRGLLLAHHLIGHDIRFLCETKDILARDLIPRENYDLTVCPDGYRTSAVLDMHPDLVINDILDTQPTEMAALKGAGVRLVNFEDMGAGAKHADVVINALYQQQYVNGTRVLQGPDYFCLRDEFVHGTCRRKPQSTVQRILLTFGGVDEGNLTCRVLTLVAPLAREMGAHVDVIVGPGYQHVLKLNAILKEVADVTTIVSPTRTISEYMSAADIAITSAGRTALELAALQIPTVVISQNDRECTHTFASWENGFINLGHHVLLSDRELTKTLRTLANHIDLRVDMVNRMAALNLTGGVGRVVGVIEGILRGPERTQT